MSTRKPTGIRPRHSRSCRAPAGDCNCKPSWEASVFSKRDGRKIRKTFPTQAAAKSWRADAQSKIDKNRFTMPLRVTLNEAAAEFIEGIKAGTIRSRNDRPYKPSTIRSYQWALRGPEDEDRSVKDLERARNRPREERDRDRDRHVLPALGHMRLSEVRRSDVQDFADRMLADGRDPSTVTNTIDPLRAIFRRAMKREIVATNPTADLDLPKSEGKRDRIASPVEARRLIDALTPEDRALWATALYAGLRRGELRALRWADIDLAAREIYVSRGWDDIEGEIAVKTAKARRTVPILAVLVTELKRHKLLTGRGGEDLVFGQTARKSFNPSSVNRRAQEVWEAAELPRIGLHESRHTFASLLIAADVNAKAISEAMGHASIQMTFDRYGHLMPGARQELTRRVDAYLAGGRGGA